LACRGLPYHGSSRICTVGRSTLRWDSISHLKSRWKSEYPNARYSDVAVRCLLQPLTSLRPTASDTTDTTDDTQLHLSVRADNTADGLSVLAACTTDVTQWYMQTGLQLNPDKSEVLPTGTANQVQAVSSLTSVSVAGVDLPLVDSMKVLGVTLDRRLTLDNHVSAVASSCNYHARAIRHVRHH